MRHLVRQGGDQRLLRLRERVGELFRVASTRPGHRRAASPAAAHQRRGLANQCHGVETALLERPVEVDDEMDAPVLARTLGVRRLLLKFEGTNPTGTIKDRSSATAVAAARQFGYRAISVVSTGNAGSSIGAYATRAGLRAFVFCYERASAPKLAHMGAVASDLVLYQGYYDDLIRHWDRMVDELPVFDGGASRNAYKQEGKKTLAWELAEQTGFRLPDVVVYPVAVGEAFISGWRGFREMQALGWIERPPTLVAAQSADGIFLSWRYLGDEPLAQRAHVVWSALSRACHHHVYELAPTREELQAWREAVQEVVERTERAWRS